jgi:hypothetical protein
MAEAGVTAGVEAADNLEIEAVATAEGDEAVYFIADVDIQPLSVTADVVLPLVTTHLPIGANVLLKSVTRSVRIVTEKANRAELSIALPKFLLPQMTRAN